MISGQQEKKIVSKTVLITGGAGGIGREFSKLFARDGYRVVVFSLLQQELDELGGLLRQENPRCEYLPVQMDLSEPDAAQRIHDWLKAQRISLDVLVNNVGFGLFGEHVEIEVARLGKMLAINNSLLSQLCVLIGGDMKRQGRGNILNVASLAGFAPMPYFAAYSASKAYVLSFSTSLGRELAEFGVGVTCLCPSTTRTQFLDTAQGRHQSSQGITRFVSASIATPASVALAGYEGMKRGKRIVLPTAPLSLQAFIIRALPLRVAAWFVYQQARRA